MSTGLRLLDDVSHEGVAVPGERSQALLAVLARSPGLPVADTELVAAIWGPDDQPAQPGKALQVVVSRTRAQTGRDVVVLVERGYRLGLDRSAVDAARLTDLVRTAARAERTGELLTARDAARSALGLVVAGPGREPPALEELRAAARLEQETARRVLGRTASAVGDHAEALEALEALEAPEGPGGPATDAAGHLDEPTLAALLRSEAAVHGAPRALVRYERHREGVRDLLGVDPGPDLQAVHAELLAADRPVRSGVQHDTTSLVGRDDDLRILRALLRGSRVVSVLGPGGLGKTRLATLLARTTELPVVHLVELVGVVDGDDVVGELGSALGVRDSVSGLRTLTPEQRRDVRGRIAQHLDRAPTLLVLDNCEHVVAAVADLVAFLVAAVPRLRVVTTTRAPLAIAAERVFALDQLGEDDAVELFGQRARAARPGVLLDDAAVRGVVRRLDGLPLAVELAAAKVRAMSVAEIEHRLHDRFGLLRGSDASAPDRHRTLVSVIDWSWDLLDAAQRTALGRLALFQDGFDLAAAESVLGPGALADVEALVGQSLLSVRESGPVLRYRMLETVREFGLQHLGDDDLPARAAVRRWAVQLARDVLPELDGPRQVEVVRRVAAEDTNLTDVLREALGEPDPALVAELLAALGGTWTIRGEHVRIVALTGAVEAAFDGWSPPPELVEVAARAAAVMVVNTTLMGLLEPVVCRALLDAHGPDAADPATRAGYRVLTALSRDDRLVAMDAVADGDDRPAAGLALQWLSHWRENSGDAPGARDAATRALALWRPEDGVWARAFVQTQLVGLHAQAGETAQAVELAVEALTVLDALGADDDAAQLRAVLASAAIEEGRLADAQQIVDEMTVPAGGYGATNILGAVTAELALAHGDVVTGLAGYDVTVAEVRGLRYPGLLVDRGLEPWTLFIESAALTAHARHGPAGSGAGLRASLSGKIGPVLHGDPGRLDHPVAGGVLFALGSWELRAGRTGLAVRCLAVAERFAFSRYLPSMSWEWVHAELERSDPGALDAAVTAFGERRGGAVLPEARALVPELVDHGSGPA